jgi:hypothetical protein
MSRRARRKEVRRLEAFERTHLPTVEALQKRINYLAGRVRHLQVERDSLADKLLEVLSPIEVSRVEERSHRSNLIVPVTILSPYGEHALRKG